MMKRQIVMVVTLIAGITAWADEVKTATRDEVEIAELKRTGGRLYKPDSQKGEIVYVNCQTAAKEEWLKASAEYFATQTKLKVTVKPGSFVLQKPTLVGTCSLFIVDDPLLPMSLYAPEAGWAMVNVSSLKSEKPAFFEARVKKQLSRGFAYLCGAANSQYKGSLLEGITSVTALDQHVDHQLPVDIFGRIQRSMKLVGVTPARYTAYINACRQGWAPQPTNEYQKAIWDKVHELPTKPITIKPETKPVKE